MIFVFAPVLRHNMRGPPSHGVQPSVSVRTTRAVLRATVELARARMAEPLVVIPQFGSEDDAERLLRRRIVDEQVPYVLVALDAGWRLPWDRHPNAHAAHEIAAAIAAQLRHGEARR